MIGGPQAAVGTQPEEGCAPPPEPTPPSNIPQTVNQIPGSHTHPQNSTRGRREPLPRVLFLGLMLSAGFSWKQKIVPRQFYPSLCFELVKAPNGHVFAI